MTILVLTLAFLLAANFAIGVWSKRVPFKKQIDSILKASHPNLVFTGNSMMAGHVDIDQFNSITTAIGGNLHPVNAALGASQQPEQWLLFDIAMKSQPDLKMLVAGFDDTLLTADTTTTPWALTGNRLVGLDSRIPAKEALDAYNFTPFEQLEFRFLRIAPLIAHRANMWRNVELLRRRMGSMGMQASQGTELGRVEDFEAMDKGISTYFESDIARFSSNPAHFNLSYERIFSKADARHMKVVLLLMPISEQHRNRYYRRPIWTQYLENLRKLAAARGYELIDASNWVNGDENFDDPLHMSRSGIAIFTARLAEELNKRMEAAVQ